MVPGSAGVCGRIVIYSPFNLAHLEVVVGSVGTTGVVCLRGKNQITAHQVCIEIFRGIGSNVVETEHCKAKASKVGKLRAGKVIACGQHFSVYTGSNIGGVASPADHEALRTECYAAELEHHEIITAPTTFLQKQNLCHVLQSLRNKYLRLYFQNLK
jgi:hypothetical protein